MIEHLNEKHQTLYDNLMRLCDKDESSFYHVDQVVDNIKYRIFLYRLASWTEFQQPDALWSRGTMFQLDKHSKPVRLACRPMKKFFNLGEGCDVATHDFSDDNIEVIMDKADGSLISSYIHYPDPAYFTTALQVRLKTKGSLHSEQAVAAYKWLHQPENKELLDCIVRDTLLNRTVNLEWVGICNRIVLGYEKTELKVLSVIDNVTGETYAYKGVANRYPEGSMVANYTEQAKSQGVAAYIQSVHAMTGVEGIVIRLKDGLMLKVKTTAYVALHSVKSSISAPRNLFEAIVNETGDDLRVMFLQDPTALKAIDDMQVKVSHIMNSLVKTVEAFYETNKHLGRKDYAVLGQSQLDRMHFALAMTLYTNGTPDYKYTLIKNYKEFNISDEPTVAQDEQHG